MPRSTFSLRTEGRQWCATFTWFMCALPSSRVHGDLHDDHFHTPHPPFHRLGVLCATSLKPHSLTSLVAMCDSGDVYTEAYIHLTAHGKAAAEGATSSREGALDNGDQTHALSRAPSLARALGGFRCGSRVLPCKSQVSVHVWRASTTRMGHAILTASACSPGRGALGSVAPASLSRGACAPRP